MKKSRPQSKLKRKRPGRSFSGAWEQAPAPEPRESEDVMELDTWQRRGTAEDERRRITASFRDMGIGTD